LVGKTKSEKTNQQGVGVDGRIILKWILGKSGEKAWTGCICFKTGTSDEFL
jgi:hypothetical protein